MKAAALFFLVSWLAACDRSSSRQSLPPVRVEESPSSAPTIVPAMDSGPFELWLKTAFQGTETEAPQLRLNDVDLPLNESGVVTGLALPGPNVVELLWLAQVSKPQSFQIRLELQSKDAKSVLLSFEDLVTETELRLGKPLSTRSFRFSFPESHPVPLWWQSSKVATVSDPKCRLAGFGRLVSCRTGLRSWSHRFENSGQSLWLKTLQ